MNPEQANSTIVRIADERALADTTHYTNPSIFMINGFHAIATQYADGAIAIEVAEDTFNIGGRVWPTELGVTYNKLVKYLSEHGDRIARICRNPEYKIGDFTDSTTWAKYRLVLGRSTDGETFERIKTVFDLKSLSTADQIKVYLSVKAIRKARRAARSACLSSMGLLEQLHALKARLANGTK